MKKQTFSVVAIFALLTINAYSLYRMLDIKKEADATVNHTKELYNNAKVFYKVIYDDFMQTKYSDNYPINPDFVLKSSLKDSVTLYDLVHDRTKLVVYFSYLHCKSCIEFQLNAVKKHIDRINRNNVLFVATYSNLREYLIDAKITELGCPIYSVIDNSFQLPIEEKNEPFFFLIDKSMRTGHVFVPRKEIPELTGDYMDMICKKYFQVDQ